MILDVVIPFVLFLSVAFVFGNHCIFLKEKNLKFKFMLE